MLIDDKMKYFFDRVMSGANGTTGNHDSDAIDHEIENPGKGHPLILNVKVQEDLTSGGAATVAISLQDSDDGASFDDAGIVVASVPVAQMVQGKLWRFALPEQCRQYTRVRYSIGTAALSGGKMAAFITEG